MTTHTKQTRVDWALGGLIFALCVVLTVLQYRWLGEVADAEVSRQRAELNEQAARTVRAFDTTLNRSLTLLLPRRGDFTNEYVEAIQLAHFKTWKASRPRPIFSRIALASADGNQIQIALLDQSSVQLVPANWPVEWSALRSNLTDKINGGSPPYDDERGTLMEFPIYDGLPGSRLRHWLIVEIDSHYLRDTWLPNLMGRYLNVSGQPPGQVVVRTVRKPPTLLYVSPASWTKTGASVVSVPFNFIGRSVLNSGGPPPTGGHWLLETWHPPGQLEAIVSATRFRNLAVALAINLLMLATGLALIHHTRKSRQIAEQQINFVAHVTHELRTPLTVIRGAAHNMQRGVVYEPGQIKKYSGLIVEHCEQLSEMVEEVLAFAGAQKNGSVALREPVMLPGILDEAIAATAHDVETAHCQVDVDLPEELPVVMGDPGALRRLFQNLITNAARHGGRGGWVGVIGSVQKEEGNPVVEIKIADRGPGIPPEELTEIFKPFFRGAQAAHVRGSGLGLSLVREIAETHGGSVSVRSENGQGAIFIVRLPVTETESLK